jgi:uncharacterized protein (DUF2461 family)
MTDTTTEFRGWPADATTFLAELTDDNSREFWTANTHRYRAALLEPTRALAAALAEEFGLPRVFRPHVDRRFRPNADPYRTDTGATVAGPGGTPHALVLAACGLAVQVGYQIFDAGQLRRYRTAVDDAPGDDLEAILAALSRNGARPRRRAGVDREAAGLPGGPSAAAPPAPARDARRPVLAGRRLAADRRRAGACAVGMAGGPAVGRVARHPRRPARHT